jgi:uncharacterized SAM-binding protein YcdF (DUF218 family)
VVVVAHPDHVWRAVRTAENLGLQVVVADTSAVPCDPDSVQKWTRSRARLRSREILVRIYYLMRGYL